MFCLKLLADYYVLIYNHCQMLMKSVSHPDSFITAIHDEIEGLTLCGRLP
jgi:hypothetical protein